MCAVSGCSNLAVSRLFVYLSVDSLFAVCTLPVFLTKENKCYFGSAFFHVLCSAFMN